MYKVIYYLVDGSSVSTELSGRSEEDMVDMDYGIRRMITTGGTIQLNKRTPTGYAEVITINAKNITKIECINLDDKVTEE